MMMMMMVVVVVVVVMIMSILTQSLSPALSIHILLTFHLHLPPSLSHYTLMMAMTDVSHNESMRMLKLTTNSVEPLKFYIPRKGSEFQSELFPGMPPPPPPPLSLSLSLSLFLSLSVCVCCVSLYYYEP